MATRGIKMDINGADFETRQSDNRFFISQTGEGDMSDDGGYTFETTTWTEALDLSQVIQLRDELNEFINKQGKGK